MSLKKIAKKLSKVILYGLALILVVFLGVILLIKSPSGQRLLITKATSFIAQKTNTSVEIANLFVTFSGNIQVNGVYLGDKKNDTLLFSKSLIADIQISPLIFNNTLAINSVEWEGLVTNISRPSDSENFNYQFLIDAFVSETPVEESTSDPLNIELGVLQFSNFKIRYTDHFLGMIASVDLGELKVSAEKTDLQEMVFSFDDVQLSNSKISYVQSKAIAVTDTTKTALPLLKLDNLQVNNVAIDYSAVPDSLSIKMYLGTLQLNLPIANLESNIFKIKALSLEDSRCSLQLPATEVSNDAALPNIKGSKDLEKLDFIWPDYDVDVKNVTLKNSRVALKIGDSNSEKGVFNPNNIVFSDIDVALSAAKYTPKEASIVLNSASFAEQSGIVLKDFRFNTTLDDTTLNVNNFYLATNNSAVAGALNSSFTSISSVFSSPTKTKIALNFPTISIGVEDIFPFMPELKENEAIQKIAAHKIKGAIDLKGSLEELAINNFAINWATGTSLKAKGNIKNVLDVALLKFDLDTIQAKLVRQDMLVWLQEEDLSVALPKMLTLDATTSGSLDTIKFNANAKIPEGRLNVDGHVALLNDQIKFDTRATIEALQLGSLLQNEQLGTLSLKLNAKGQGSSLETLDATLQTTISTLEVGDYNFNKLVLDGTINNGVGTINLGYKDTNLNADATATITLNSKSSKVLLETSIIGADLNALGFTRDGIKVGLQASVNFEGTASTFNMGGAINQAIVIHDNEQYLLDPIAFGVTLDSLKTKGFVQSEFLEGNLDANASPQQISTSLQHQFTHYFQKGIVSEQASIPDSVNATIRLKLIPNKVLTDVFLRGIQQLDTVRLKGDFNAASQQISGVVEVPSFKYEGTEVDSLSLTLKGDTKDLNFLASIAALRSGPVAIEKTKLSGAFKNHQLLLDFSSLDKEAVVMHVAGEVALEDAITTVHIAPDNLVLNRKQWSIPQTNKIVNSKEELKVENVLLSRNGQSLAITTSINDAEKEQLAFTFDNFKLQTLLGFLNPDEALASGKLLGNIIVEDPLGNSGIIADFTINDLFVTGHPLGNLTLEATAKNASMYDFNVALKDGGVDAVLKGNYSVSTENTKVSVDLAIKKIELKTIEDFSEGYIKNSNGFISGTASISGNLSAPKYSGLVKFNNAEVNIASLNTVFKVIDNEISVTNKGLFIENFKINDANDNSFVLDGKIGTKELANPTFDLKLNAKKFKVLDATKEDNDLLFGILSLDAKLNIKGDLEIPKVDGKLRVRKRTDITYVVPESQLDIQERDGVVLFVNKENPDAILTRNEEEQAPSTFGGFDVKVILEIAEDADFHVIIDERTGDNLELSGDAALNLNIEPSGRIDLSGRYELKKGHYETNLYNLVKRRFDIKQGSTITWQGDPMDAKLDVTAVYPLETSAASLMSSVTSGQDASETGKYRQVLPFLVYLNVKGELLTPELSFGLDMPESAQGSLSGTVYSRLQQLNQTEAALNKQVFSLLALNRFYPDSGSDGSGGGTAGIARDNVNKVLSGELNAFSDKIFGNSGFDVDFDLDSFTDYQGENPQDRTQLNINAKKSLFNERLIVSAGSAVDVAGSAQADQGATPIIGNVSLEYLLTKDGRYRFRGFRKSEYQNIIDGQLIVTGVALIFNREFNSFSQLFNPIKATIPKEETDPNGSDTQKKDSDPTNKNDSLK